MKKMAIIGTGMSGLTLAHLLKNDVEITLFEKARGVGGRMATRRADQFQFDHGAQYFTCRSAEFQSFIKPLLENGVIARWDAKYAKFHAAKRIEQKHWQNEAPRYVGIPKMNSIGKYLAEGLLIHQNTKIIALNPKQNTWQLVDENDHSYPDFDWVICTTPSPQALDLMPRDAVFYPNVKNILMTPCLSVMLGFDSALTCDFDAAHVIDSDISWVAIDNNKPSRTSPMTVVIHSSEAYASQHIDEPQDKVLAHLLVVASDILGKKVFDASYQTLHRWRFANNLERHQSNSVLIDSDLKLAVCGDWWSGGRVEGAFLSAHHLAKTLLDLFSKAMDKA